MLDLNDKRYEKEAVELRLNSFHNQEEYNKLYEGLDHLFICKKNLESDLKKIGFKDILFFDPIAKDENIRKYRFNVIASKLI